MGENIDIALLRGFAAGEPLAAKAVVDLFHRPLLNFLLRIGCPPVDADDIIQVSFLKAAHGLRKNYRHTGTFRSWLVRITRNTYRDFKRSAFVRREIPVETVQLASDVCPGPEAVVLQAEREAAVRRAVGELPEPQRVCLVLRYYHGFSLSEIAASVQVPEGTVKSRLYTALRALQSKLKEETR